MEDITSLLDYFKKLQKAIDNADLRLFQYKLVKKVRIDDLLVCTLAVLPDAYKKAMKTRVNNNLYPSVSCYSRLSKIIKKPFFLNKDYYLINFGEANVLLKSIRQSIERDLIRLEKEEN